MRTYQSMRLQSVLSDLKNPRYILARASDPHPEKTWGIWCPYHPSTLNIGQDLQPVRCVGTSYDGLAVCVARTLLKKALEFHPIRGFINPHGDRRISPAVKHVL